MIFLKPLIDRIETSFRQNKNIKQEDIRFYIFSSYLYFLCLILHAALLVLFLLINVHLMAIFNIFSCIIFAANLIINQKGKLNLAYHIAISEITIHAALATLCLGWASNFCFYSIAICSVIMFSTFLNLRTKIFEITLSTILYLIAFVYIMRYSTLYEVDILIVSAIGLTNILVIIPLLSAIFYRFYMATDVLNKKLKEAAEIDGLTGAYNRRFFNEYTEIEVKRMLSDIKYRPEGEQPFNFGLAIMDIDDFKKINDTHGHITGDNVLVQIVEIIKKITFSRDLICRYGGEEFVILFTKTFKDGAIIASEKIRKEIEKYKFFFNDEIRDGHITISIGFASFDDNVGNYDVESILKIADDRLYKAKKTGKNKLVYQ